MSVAAAVVEGSGFEKVEESVGDKHENDRLSVLAEMGQQMRSTTPEFKANAKDLLARVYASFTRKELTSLFNSKEDLAKTLPAENLDRKTIQKGFGKLGRAGTIATAPRHSSVTFTALNKPAMAQSMGYGR